MKIKDLKFYKNIYTQTDMIFTDSCIFKVLWYFEEAEKYWNKSYGVLVNYYDDFKLDKLVNSNSPYIEKVRLLSIEKKISVKELIENWLVINLFLYELAKKNNTRYDFTKREFEAFLEPLKQLEQWMNS
jgi:hypothetical protein